ncbi:MAG TPA: hypothetical protein VND92_04310 [Vicinamibacterales bacterium]|nr:hypothetical protein [Vicinamibacterales bacterium]
MTLLTRIISILDASGVPWAVIGAAALAVHGISRSTLDLDLLVTDSRVMDRTMWIALEAIAAVDVRRGDADDPLAGVIRFEAPGERTVDLVVGRSPWQRDLISRSETVDGGGTALHVARAADLVLLKLYAGGSQDRWDIEQLLAGEGRQALVAEVEQRMDVLPDRCRDLWVRIARPD